MHARTHAHTHARTHAHTHTHTHTYFTLSHCVETDFHYSMDTSKGTRGFVAVDVAVDVVVVVFVGRLRESYGRSKDPKESCQC